MIKVEKLAGLFFMGASAEVKKNRTAKNCHCLHKRIFIF